MWWRLRESPPGSFLKKVFLFLWGFNQALWDVWTVDKSSERSSLRVLDEHQEGSRLFKQITHLHYYSRTVETEAVSFARRSQACNLTIIEPTLLQMNSTAFIRLGLRIWAFDLIGPINLPSQGNIWILAAIEYYTKWVVAIALKRAHETTTANYIWDNIIYHFGIPKRQLYLTTALLTDMTTLATHSSYRARGRARPAQGHPLHYEDGQGKSIGSPVLQTAKQHVQDIWYVRKAYTTQALLMPSPSSKKWTQVVHLPGFST